MDLLEDEPEETGGSNAPEFTVSEISGAVKRTIEGAFDRIRVRGEVGRVFRARSGHLYYDVKDDRSVLACTTWKGQLSKLAVQPEEGLEVIVTGKLTAFGAQSKYNMNVEDVTVAGQGALMAMLEKRKKALDAEGLFAPERKRPLPYLPDVVGVITSPSGAVIRDILHRLRDRFPRKVLIWPVAVQGTNCAPEVANAIKGFNQFTPGGALPRPDVLIVARGGGSIEDLWGFNEEIVARTAADSDIPLISAVGHETDTTLIDFVSDKRAPTPTAAAEMAVPVRLDLMAWVDEQSARLSRAAAQRLAQRGQRLRDLARALPRPETLVSQAAQRLDYAAARLPRALTANVDRQRVRLGRVAGAVRPHLLSGTLRQAQQRLGALDARHQPALGRNLAMQSKALDTLVARLGRAAPTENLALAVQDLARLDERLSAALSNDLTKRHDKLTAIDRLRQSLGYQSTLARGYAVVRDSEGRVITTTQSARTAGALELEFADGRFTASGSTSDTPKPRVLAKPKSKSSKEPPDQGSLF
jgi:exodeoxyribonuclease VII large subunit